MRRYAVPEKLAVLGPRNGAFLAIDLQPEPFRKEAFQRCHHSFSRRLRSNVHVAIVGITSETMASPLEFFIQLIEQDVTQQR